MSLRALLFSSIAAVLAPSVGEAAKLYVAEPMRAYALSADGTTLVGDTFGSRPQALRWRRPRAPELLQHVVEGHNSSSARGVSADGSWTVGHDRGPFGNYPVRWLPDGTGEQFPYSIFFPRGQARGVAAAGYPAAGYLLRSSSALDWEAALWTIEPRNQIWLGYLPGGTPPSVATDISDDGSLIVGYSDSPNAPEREWEAFTWTASSGMVGLGALPGGDGASRAADVSPNGVFVVGASSSERGDLTAFRWSASDGMMDLCNPEYCIADHDVWATGVTDDGNTVVGFRSAHISSEAFIWTSTRGMRSLRSFAEQDLGLEIPTWVFWSAVGISAGGTVIAGTGQGEDLSTTAWILDLNVLEVRLDIKPGSELNPINPSARGLIPVAILGSESLDVRDVDVTTLSFGRNLTAPEHRQGGHVEDVNGDGLADLVSHYRTLDAGIAFGDTLVCVTGRLLDGTPIDGCDEIVTLGACGLGFELSVLLPGLLWLRERGRAALARCGPEPPPIPA